MEIKQKSFLQFYGVMILLGIIKIFLISHFQIIGIPSNTDDFHYIKLAYFFSNNKWLGPYDQYTILKNGFYSIYVGFTSKFGIPLIVNWHILYILAGIYIFSGLKSMKFKEPILIILFALFVFNPMTHSADNFRTVRDPIFMCFNLLFIGALINGSLTNPKIWIRIVHWVLGGIFAAFAYYTKEEGMWILISFLIYSMSYLLYIYLKFKDLKKAGFELILILVAFSSLQIVLNSYKMMNYKKYKVFRLSDIENGIEEKRAFGYLLKLDPEKRINNVPVLKETRYKLYNVVPAFKEMEPFEVPIFQGWSEGRMGNPGCPEPLGKICEETTHFGWAFKNAMTAMGYYASARIADRYYERLANDLKIAIDEGKLSYEKPHSLQKFIPYIDLNIFNIKDVTSEYFKGLKFFSSLEGYDPEKCGSAQYSYGNQETIQITEKLTNSSLKLENNNLNTSNFNSTKITALNLIYNVYHIISPYIFILSLIGFLAGIILSIYTKQLSIIWIISFTLISSFTIRFFILSYLSVYGHGYINVQYLTPLYPYIYLIGALVLIGFLEIIGNPQLLILKANKNQ